MSASTTTYSPIVSPRTGRREYSPHGIVWTHLPWLLVLLAAPFCFGAVDGVSQSVLALGMVASLFCTAMHLRVLPQSIPGKLLLALLCVTLIFPLVPLGPSALKFLSAEAGRLNERFGLRTLALSPADAIVRAWQLGMIAAVFLLARAAARVHRFAEVFVVGAAIALLGLAATEFWLLIDGRGVWKEPRHYPAGTFANRNHFASWMVMGAMLMIGAVLRKIRRLRSTDQNSNDLWALIFFATALASSIAAVVACGSRGGMLALAAGCGVWTFILVRERSGTSALAVFLITGLSLAGAFALSGELFMQRLTHDALEFKLRIWRDALTIAMNSPLFGVGLGGFETAFTMHKTFHGEGTFLFAENEYVQWIVETGLVGTACAAGLVLLLVKKFGVFSGARAARAEYYQGAIAACAAFAVHASVEFVAQVMATALLAASMLGLALGLKDRADAPAVELSPGKSNLVAVLLLALGLVSLAAPQLLAAARWNEPRSAGATDDSRTVAFRAWPLDKERAIFLARELITSTELGRIRSENPRKEAMETLAQALRWRPLSWELRLERAWLEIAAAPGGSAPAVIEAMALNPLQPQIPLRCAASLASLHPPSALEILKAGEYLKSAEVYDALKIAWSVQRSPDVLWEIAPANPAGMQALEKFARERRLTNLAEQAVALQSDRTGADRSDH